MGCNGFGVDYQLEGNSIVTSNLQPETALCAVADGSEDMVAGEVVLSGMFTDSSGFAISIEGDIMTWRGGGHTVVFASAHGEPPTPTTSPSGSFGPLDCGSAIVVEVRHPDANTSPEQLARSAEPTTVRVDKDAPLQWWGYDESGRVSVGVLLGDIPDADYQIVTLRTLTPAIPAEWSAVGVAGFRHGWPAGCATRSCRPVRFLDTGSDSAGGAPGDRAHTSASWSISVRPLAGAFHGTRW